MRENMSTKRDIQSHIALLYAHVPLLQWWVVSYFFELFYFIYLFIYLLIRYATDTTKILCNISAGTTGQHKTTASLVCINYHCSFTVVLSVVALVHHTNCLASPLTFSLFVAFWYSSFGDRTFAAAGTKMWNSLPPDLRQPDCHTANSGGHWRHFIWTVRSQRSVNFFELRRLEIFLLTYLLIVSLFRETVFSVHS